LTAAAAGAAAAAAAYYATASDYTSVAVQKAAVASKEYATTAQQVATEYTAHGAKLARQYSTVGSELAVQYGTAGSKLARQYSVAASAAAVQYAATASQYAAVASESADQYVATATAASRPTVVSVLGEESADVVLGAIRNYYRVMGGVIVLLLGVALWAALRPGSGRPRQPAPSATATPAARREQRREDLLRQLPLYASLAAVAIILLAPLGMLLFYPSFLKLAGLTSNPVTAMLVLAAVQRYYRHLLGAFVLLALLAVFATGKVGAILLAARKKAAAATAVDDATIATAQGVVYTGMDATDKVALLGLLLVIPAVLMALRAGYSLATPEALAKAASASATAAAATSAGRRRHHQQQLAATDVMTFLSATAMQYYGYLWVLGLLVLMAYWVISKRQSSRSAARRAALADGQVTFSVMLVKNRVG
jgi:hypothetical protein